MRRTSVWGLCTAVLSGAAIASCNLTLGLDPYFMGAGGSGSTSTGSTISSSGNVGGSVGDAGDAGDSGEGGPPEGGLPIWAKSFGNGKDLRVGGVAVDADGNVYVAGWAEGFVDFGCSDGPLDVGTGAHGYAVKLGGADGACVWQMAMLSTSTTQATAIAIGKDNSVIIGGGYQGTLLLAGAAAAPAATMVDAFVAQFNQEGEKPLASWARYWGGNGDQLVRSVAVDAAGQVYTGGTFTIAFKDSLTQNSAGGSDTFLLKLDSADSGKTMAGMVAGGSGADVMRSLSVSDKIDIVAAVGHADASVTLDGNTIPNVGGDDVLVARYTIGIETPAGKLFGDLTAQQGRSGVFGSDGDFYLAGITEGALDFGSGAAIPVPAAATAFLAHFEPSGLASAALSFGTSPSVGGPIDVDDGGVATNEDHAICVAADGTSVVMAASLKGPVKLPQRTVSTSGTGHDLVLARLDKDIGLTIWAHSFGKSGDQSPEGIALDSTGNVIVAGHYSGTLDFGGAVGIRNSTGLKDIFVAKLGP